MRILSITPIRVTEHELARRQQRYNRSGPRLVDPTRLALELLGLQARSAVSA